MPVRTDCLNVPAAWVPLAIKTAHDHDIAVVDFLALLLHESAGGDAAAWRYEPGFYKKYLQGRTQQSLGGIWPTADPMAISLEYYHRACSWGHSQVMGQTARELGFKKWTLVELIRPELNIPLGAKYFKRCLEKKGDLFDALLCYNGGADSEYPNKVAKWRDEAEQLVKCYS